MGDLIFARKWKVVRTIGTGGMGTVYEVEHLRLPRRRALKRLRQELSDDPNIERRFYREAVMMAELEHPHIVTVHDVDVDDELGAFILMDLVHGVNLAQMINEQGRLPFGEVVRIGCQIASALDFAHSRGVVHRDLKPGNILIDSANGNALLTDFGIAKQISRGGDQTTGDPTTSFVGTYRYSSPEQMRNDEIDSRADIYSLGVVLYESSTGTRFLKEIREEAIPAHVMGYVKGWEPRIQFPAGVPGRFHELVRECLILNRNERIESAAIVLRRLPECDSDLSAGVDPTSIQDAPLGRAATEVTRAQSFISERAALRNTAERILSHVETLATEASRLGVWFEDTEAVAALREALGEISALEEERAFGMAYRRLNDLAEEARVILATRERRTRDAVVESLERAEAEWAAIVGAAEDFLGDDLAAQWARKTEDLRRSVDGGDVVSLVGGVHELLDLLCEAERRRLLGRLRGLESKVDEFGAVLAQAEHVGVEVLCQDNHVVLRSRIQACAKELSGGELGELKEQVESVARQVDEAISSMRGHVAEGVGERLRDLRDQVASMVGNAGRFARMHENLVPPTGQREALEHRDPEDFASVLSIISSVESGLRDFVSTVGVSASLAVQSSLDEAREIAAELEEAGGSMSFDVEVLSRELAAELSSYRWEDACNEAESRVAEARQIRDAIVEARISKARDSAIAAQQAITNLPVEPAEIESCRRLMEQASSAAGWRELVRAYEEGRGRWDALRAIGQERAGQIEDARREIEVLIDRARPAPVEVVGKALLEAETELRREPLCDPRSLRKAAQKLARSLDDVPLFENARSRRQLLESEISRRGSGSASKWRLRRCLWLQREAMAAFERSEWEKAARDFAKALACLPDAAVAATTAAPFSWGRRPKLLVGGVVVGVLALAGGYLGDYLLDEASEASPLTLKEREAVQTSELLQPMILSAESGGSLVEVDPRNVNRPPVVAVDPPVGRPLQSRRGDKLNFRIAADDPDGDQLLIHWQDRGERIATGPELTLEVEGPHQIDAIVEDGNSEPVRVGPWEVALTDAEPLQLGVRPRRLGTLVFDIPQSFEVEIPRDLRSKDLVYDWRLNGRKVSEQPSFLLLNDDAGLIGNERVSLSVLVEHGDRSFSHEWRFRVKPRRPRIVATNPATPSISAIVGQELIVEVGAADPIGNQVLTYVFRTDEDVQESQRPSYRIDSSQAGRFDVAAMIRDNYGQESEARAWTIEIRPAEELIDHRALIREWLNQLLAAETAGRIDVIVDLRRLSAAERQRLEQSMRTKSGFEVEFMDIAIEEDGENRYRVTYDRRERFRDPSGKAQEIEVRVVDRVRLDDGIVVREGVS
jgi:serine/threonine protein kinase